MYTITKRFEISGAHYLNLDYNSKCSNIHGHNWTVEVTCKSDELDGNGMVYDFSKIKNIISDKLDHKCLNNVLPFNPTAENIAAWIAVEIGPICSKVKIIESEGNTAIYEV